MIDLQLRVAGEYKCYRGTLAGQRTLSSLACAHLQTDENAEPLGLGLTHESEGFPPHDPIACDPSACDPSACVEIHAELEAKPITLRALHTPQRSYFSCPSASFWVAADGRSATLTHCVVEPVPWLFGPALILALARLGVYCLHASAFRDGEVASVFVGHSGAGKSTLARAVSSRAGAQRLCDDITPIALRAGKLYVLPRFPQLKLTTTDKNLPEAVPLKRIVLLQAAQDGIASEHQSLGQRALFEALTRHTVATRLYSATDTRNWWQQLPLMMAALVDTRSIRPAFNAHAPERAMLAALDDLDGLCG